jgi:hypothetical protein
VEAQSANSSRKRCWYLLILAGFSIQNGHTLCLQHQAHMKVYRLQCSFAGALSADAPKLLLLLLLLLMFLILLLSIPLTGVPVWPFIF